MSKPLARYHDEEDLERLLKEREREGDPMLAFMKKKNKGNKETKNKKKPKKGEDNFIIDDLILQHVYCICYQTYQCIL